MNDNPHVTSFLPPEGAQAALGRPGDGLESDL
jgi:hypothetical protein